MNSVRSNTLHAYVVHIRNQALLPCYIGKQDNLLGVSGKKISEQGKHPLKMCKNF